LGQIVENSYSLDAILALKQGTLVNVYIKIKIFSRENFSGKSSEKKEGNMQNF